MIKVKNVEDKKLGSILKKGFMLLTTSIMLGAPVEGLADTYVVNPGDNLKKICDTFYGRTDYYDELARYNGIAEPYAIYANQVLDVPRDVHTLDPMHQNDYSSGVIEHEFQPNDTLWKLCKQYYGSGTYWELLKNYNGIPDETKIRDGKIIYIPSLAVLTGEEQQQSYGGQVNLMSLEEISQYAYGSTTFANTLAALNGVYYMGLYDMESLFVPIPQEIYSYYEKYHSDRYHVVQPGDTIYSLTMQYYGSLDYVHLITGPNGLSASDSLTLDQVLLIPNNNLGKTK